jgi:Zn-dependent peptidase ImmA (M78 family)
VFSSSEILCQARAGTGLEVEDLARILELPARDVGDYEGGRQPPLWVLERYATTLGTPFAAFLQGGAAQSPATLLFRSAAEHGSDLGKLLQPSDLRVLGDFLVCVSEFAELERRPETARQTKLSTISAADVTEHEWEQGRDLALAVRHEFGLGVEPIESMVGLLQDRLDVLLFFVRGQLDDSVQGASTLAPRPAILVNLIRGQAAWWATRVSLAHELCHLLFDFGAAARPYLVSPPGSGGQWGIVERFRSIERRANAFAVHLLAPGEGIRQVLAQRAPDSEQAIDGVCRHFGVGRTVAVRRLAQEFQLSETWMVQKLDRVGEPHEPQHPDAAIPLGLRAGRLRELVGRALASGDIDSVQARGILRTPLHVELDFGVFRDPPVIDEQHAARSKAEALAHARGESNFWSTDARRTNDGWDVDLCFLRDGKKTERVVRLSHGLEPLPAGA